MLPSRSAPTASALFSGFSRAERRLRQRDAKSISSIVFVFDVPPLIWVQIKPASLIGAFQLLRQRNRDEHPRSLRYRRHNQALNTEPNTGFVLMARLLSVSD